jgi:hypothetical protein
MKLRSWVMRRSSPGQLWRKRSSQRMEEQLEVADQDLGQVETDLVAAGELGRTLLQVGRFEAQAGEDLLDPPDLVMGVVGQGLGPFGQDGRLREIQALLDVADAVFPRLGDRPRVRLLLARDHPEERRFAVAVPADDADPLTAVDLEADRVEEPLLSVALRKVINDDHEALAISKYVRPALSSFACPKKSPTDPTTAPSP